MKLRFSTVRWDVTIGGVAYEPTCPDSRCIIRLKCLYCHIYLMVTTCYNHKLISFTCMKPTAVTKLLHLVINATVMYWYVGRMSPKVVLELVNPISFQPSEYVLGIERNLSLA